MATDEAGAPVPAPANPYGDSKSLDPAEKQQAAEHAAPAAVVIHEILRKEGQAELERRVSALFWSGLAAGLSMGFSFLTLAMIQGALPDAPWRRLLAGFGYSLGFVIAVLGRQQLFTETTLTAVLPLLTRPEWRGVAALARFWAVVLAANLIGTFVFARILAIDGLFSGPTRDALGEIAEASVRGSFWPTAIGAVFAGWLIALMIWLLPSARSARLFVIVMLTYVVPVGGFSHVIAGSVEAAYAFFMGRSSLADYAVGFFLPTILGNTVGGVALVALLNHAPLAPDVQE
jgi:formate/nitrite transporter FocA (FNT family)